MNPLLTVCVLYAYLEALAQRLRQKVVAMAKIFDFRLVYGDAFLIDRFWLPCKKVECQREAQGLSAQAPKLQTN